MKPGWKKAVIASLLLALAAVSAWIYFRYHPSDGLEKREDLLSRLPADSTSVFFFDLRELRGSPLLAQILALAPHPPPEEEYEKFVQATGFDYERDLDRAAISFSGTTQNPKTMAVAEGRFDRKKVESYSGHFGTLQTANGKTIYAVPLSTPGRTAYFTFLRDDQVAVCNDASCFFQPSTSSRDSNDWREHFSRLAGTPLFAIARQDSQLLSTFAPQGTGKFRSPELAAMLGQLQWVSLSAKPEGEQLRVVVDGESGNENVIRQLKEMLGGLLLLAQAGLDDPKTRKKMEPGIRESYLELLKSAEVEKIDRGTTKSVRLIFEVTPQLLKSLGTTEPAVKAGAR